MTAQKHARSKKTPKRQAIFFAKLMEGETVKQAAAAAGFSTYTVYNWKRTDPEFAKQFADAYDTGSDVLKTEAYRRAVDGVKEPVFFEGAKIAEVTKYSDQLLITLLKMRCPKEFQQHVKNEHTGAEGAPLFTGIRRIVVDPAQPAEPAEQ